MCREWGSPLRAFFASVLLSTLGAAAWPNRSVSLLPSFCGDEFFLLTARRSGRFTPSLGTYQAVRPKTFDMYNLLLAV